MRDPISKAKDARKGIQEAEGQQEQNEQSIEAKTGAVRLALARNLARAHIASPLTA